MRKLTAPERIRQWVEREFAAYLVDRVTEELIEVASGTRRGSRFDREAVAKIFPENHPCES